MAIFSLPALFLILFLAGSFAYLSWQANIDIPSKDMLFKVESRDRITISRKNQSDILVEWDSTITPTSLTISRKGTGEQEIELVDFLPGHPSLLLSGIPAHPRPYFNLRSVDTPNTISIAERLLPFENIHNFRDLGGYLAEDLRPLRWGLVYRSGHLGNPSERDKALLQDLGIQTIIDLRGTTERKNSPDVIFPGIQYLHIPLFRSDPFGFTHILFQRHKLGQRLEEIYTSWVIDGSAKELGRIFHLMNNPANLPILFHCTAGKDRTGITAALLLLTLGVPEKTVIADYSLSNASADRFIVDYAKSISSVRFLGIKQEHFYPIIATPPQMMESTIFYIKRKYGSVHSYLTKTAGVPEKVLQHLKDLLLE